MQFPAAAGAGSAGPGHSEEPPPVRPGPVRWKRRPGLSGYPQGKPRLRRHRPRRNRSGAHLSAPGSPVQAPIPPMHPRSR